MGILGSNNDELKSLLSEIRDLLVNLREDVQRAAVTSGLLSRPGGQRIEEIIDAANRVSESVKN